MKNILLITIHCIAIGSMLLGCCAMEITPVVAAMVFIPAGWFLLFGIANRGCW